MDNRGSVSIPTVALLVFVIIVALGIWNLVIFGYFARAETPEDSERIAVTQGLGSIEHDVGSVWTERKPPTCTEMGEKYRRCLRYNDCQYQETRSIPPLGHLWINNWVSVESPTCTEGGLMHRECARAGCTEYQIRTIQELGHDTYKEFEGFRMDDLGQLLGLTEYDALKLMGESERSVMVDNFYSWVYEPTGLGGYYTTLAFNKGVIHRVTQLSGSSYALFGIKAGISHASADQYLVNSGFLSVDLTDDAGYLVGEYAYSTREGLISLDLYINPYTEVVDIINATISPWDYPSWSLPDPWQPPALQDASYYPDTYYASDTSGP